LAERKKRERGNSPDLIKFIQSMQRVEGEMDCFGRPESYCESPDCVWRDYCLKELGQGIKKKEQ